MRNNLITNKYIGLLLSEEVVGWFLWIPFLVSIGISFFLCTTIKVHYHDSMSILVICVITLFTLIKKYRKYIGAKIFFWHSVLTTIGIITGILFGYSVANYRYYSLSTPTLEQAIPSAMITGRIIDIEERENDYRLYLDNLTVNPNSYNKYYPNQYNAPYNNIYQNNNKNEVTLKQIRINTRYRHRNTLRVGDYIRLNAQLMPPPKPTYPEGFDFSRHAYFKGIGAIGYAISNIYVIQGVGRAAAKQQTTNHNSSVAAPAAINYNSTAPSANTSRHTIVANNIITKAINYISAIRSCISYKIRAFLLEPSSSIATGMLINEISTISANNFDALRISGTAHLIAISGMHVVAVASIIFVLVHFICSRFHRFTLRYNIKKVASGITIIAIWFYLLISNAPVSAQRAVITATIFFMATLINRDADPMRSLAVAAIIILTITPEMLLNPSLQMSFAACGSLILVFKYYKSPSIHHKRYYYVIKNYTTKLIIASAAASAATSPFIAYHFHQISLYSILANLICVPLADFIIMPMGLMSIMLMPVNLEAIPLYFMDWGIKLLLWLAHFFADLPFSSYNGIYISAWQLATLSAAFYGLCVSITTQIKIVATATLTITLLSCFIIIRPIPDLIISGNGNLFAINSKLLNYDKNENIHNIKTSLPANLIFSSKSKERYTRITWQQILGNNNFSNAAIRKVYPKCNETYCEFIMMTVSGPRVCSINLNSDEIFRIGNQTILTKNALDTYGTHVVYLKDDWVEMQNTNNDITKFDYNR